MASPRAPLLSDGEPPRAPARRRQPPAVSCGGARHPASAALRGGNKCRPPSGPPVVAPGIGPLQPHTAALGVRPPRLLDAVPGVPLQPRMPTTSRWPPASGILLRLMLSCPAAGKKGLPQRSPASAAAAPQHYGHMQQSFHATDIAAAQHSSRRMELLLLDIVVRGR